MSSFLFIFAVLLYALILVILFAYGMNFLYLAYITWRRNGPDPVAPALPTLPRVSVQLPVFNELYVAERLIDAAARLDWDADKLEILVLDDSTDETRDIVEKTVERWREQGVNIKPLHRTERTGFKAGALAEGLRASDAEFIAYFDADFMPPPDFLRKTVPYFADPKMAFVQTRWGHVNRDYSLLTFLQSLAIDAHFVVEQFARSRGGYWFNFNGTAGVWRRAALEAAGGWRADTLTEDLDVSYRAFLRGWKALYLRDVVTPAELPVTFTAFRRQQHRWAKGSLECAFKLLPEVWEAPIGLRQKLEATLHLTGYSIHLFMFGLMLVYPVVVYFSHQFPSLLALYGIGSLFNLSALAPTMYFTLAQKQIGRNWWRKVPAILFIMALGAGMMTNTVRAAWQIAFGQARTFERTPKFGIAERDQSWLNRRYQLRLDPLVYFEFLVGLWNLGTMIYALLMSNWVIAFYSGIFFVGVLFVSGLTVVQSLAVWQYQKKQALLTPSA
jgi:cellulose synthase/poly-beta-1,6-N-acetylglucosamine synthase-like glycosyltransferase